LCRADDLDRFSGLGLSLQSSIWKNAPLKSEGQFPTASRMIFTYSVQYCNGGHNAQRRPNAHLRIFPRAANLNNVEPKPSMRDRIDGRGHARRERGRQRHTATDANSWIRDVTAASPAISVNDSRL